MSHIHQDILIEAPVEDVFALFGDTERLSEIKAIGGVEHSMSNFSGPMDQVGTTFDVKARVAGIESKGTNTVVEVEPNRLVRIRGFEGDDMIYRFEPEGDGTRVSVDDEYVTTGVFSKLIDKVVLHNTMDRATRDFLEKMKEIAEAKVPVKD
jgi:uncharacterized membrane protein